MAYRSMRVARTALLLPSVFLVACASGRSAQDGASAPRRGTTTTADAVTLYQESGLIASALPVAFVGTVGYFRGGMSDSTLTLVTLSMPTRSLTFSREGDRFRATYTVNAELRRSGETPTRITATETVRVPSFRETQRSEESIIFQQFTQVAPGTYTLALSVRDEGGARRGSREVEITVPRMALGSVSSLIPVLEATPREHLDSIPELVASPRSTVVFGRDSIVNAYVEMYGNESGNVRVGVHARDGRGSLIWSDSVNLQSTDGIASGMIRVPVSAIGIGALQIIARNPLDSDSARAPMFVSFGDDLPVASFEDMLSYLRYYATAERLQQMRNAPPGERASAWAAFLASTDPIPSTPQHEGLQSYFARIQVANERYRQEGGAGWLTHRGMVYVTLGEPDQVLEPSGMDYGQRGQAQIWDYRRHQLRLVFLDRTGFGRWELNPSSEIEFQALLRREQVH
jgi:GWxTD domain-containing protein